MAGKIFSIGYPAKEFEKLTISNSAVGVTASKISKGVLITVEGADIRCRWDGTAPDATTGHLVLDDGSLLLENVRDVTNLKMIRDAAVDATIHVTHF